MNAIITICGKLLRKNLANTEMTLGMLIQPILWVVLFGVGMKSMLDGDNSYITFMLPGIVALTVLSGAIGGGSTWMNERILGIVKEYLVAPISRLSILFGHALSVVTISLIQAIIIIIIGLIMGASITFSVFGLVASFLLLIGFGIGFTGIALAIASKTDNPGAYHAMIMLLNLPLLFLSNALYPMNTLPTWMQWGAKINPTSYVIDGLRQTVFSSDIATTFPLWLTFVIVGSFAILGMMVALNAFKKSID